MQLDDLDTGLIAALRRDGRAGIAELAGQLGVNRATVRARLQRLIETGEITGFTALTRSDRTDSPVRALIFLQIEGGGAERITARALALPTVQAVHSTIGAWDLIADAATDTLAQIEDTVVRLRALPGVTQSQTHMIMTTRRMAPRRG